MSESARAWNAARLAVVALFLAACARSYHPDSGFLTFVRFAESTHDTQLPAIRDLPKDEQAGGYDGAFYAQLAIEPLLRNPDIDRALDEPPYRARRILFSWTAFALGLGRPAWVLQIYAVQNIVVWLLLAVVLWKLIPQTSARAFFLWCACLLSHGLLVSVWLAVTDGPSALLIILAVMAIERGRVWWPALILGAAGLARETNLLAATAFGKHLSRDWRSWMRVAGAVILAAIPLALWLDYLRSIYRQRLLVGGDHLTPALDGLTWKLNAVGQRLQAAPWTIDTAMNVLALTGFFVQGAISAGSLARDRRSAWAALAVTYFGLTLVLKAAVWEGTPGAFTRVALPMTLAVNILLSRQPRPSWWLLAAANLGVIPGVWLFGGW